MDFGFTLQTELFPSGKITTIPAGETGNQPLAQPTSAEALGRRKKTEAKPRRIKKTIPQPKKHLLEISIGRPKIPTVSRREFLAGAGVFALGVIGESILSKNRMFDSLASLMPVPGVSNPVENQNIRNGEIVVSKKETFIPLLEKAHMAFIPDGRIPYFTTKDGIKRYYFSGGPENASYMFETDGKKTLEEALLDPSVNYDSFHKVWGPDESIEFRKYYSGITSILRLDKNNPDHVLGITHNENRSSRDASGDYTATIGLIESFDAGKTWADKGPIIIGDDVVAPGEIPGRPTGAGQPSAIYNHEDGNVYIVYTDWATRQPGRISHPDQLYLARAKANDNGTIGQFEYWTTDNKFDSFKPVKLQPIIPVDESKIPHESYIALADVSFNTYLKQWMAVTETGAGFAQNTSTDLVHWSDTKLIYDFSKRGSRNHSWPMPLQGGERWDSYPTFLSEKTQSSSDITDRYGILYHSHGDNSIANPHQPMAAEANIS